MFKTYRTEDVYPRNYTVFGALAQYASLYLAAESKLDGKIKWDVTQRDNDLAQASLEYHRSLPANVATEALASAAKHASNYVGKSMPILGGLHLSSQLKTGYLAIEATNLEIGYREYVRSTARIDTVVTSARNLVDYLALEAPDVNHLFASPNGLTVLQGNHRATFKTMSADDFPPMPAAPDTILATVNDVKQFKVALKAAVSGVSKESNRPILTGVLFAFEPMLKLVSADGFKLVSKVTSIAGAESVKLVVPGNTLTQLCRTLDDNEPVTIKHAGSHVYFCQSNREIVSQLIDGKFPDYESIVPTADDIAYRVSLDLDALIATIKTLKSGADKKAVVKVAGKDGALTLSVENFERGTQTADLLYSGYAKLDLWLDIARLHSILAELGKASKKSKTVVRMVEIAVPYLKSKPITFSHNGQSAAEMQMSRPVETIASVLGHDYPAIAQYPNEDTKQQTDQREAQSEVRAYSVSPRYVPAYPTGNRSIGEFINGRYTSIDRLDEYTYAPAIVDFYTEHYRRIPPYVPPQTEHTTASTRKPFSAPKYTPSIQPNRTSSKELIAHSQSAWNSSHK